MATIEHRADLHADLERRRDPEAQVPRRVIRRSTGRVSFAEGEVQVVLQDHDQKNRELPEGAEKRGKPRTAKAHLRRPKTP
jgi:hypothetical protein